MRWGTMKPWDRSHLMLKVEALNIGRHRQMPFTGLNKFGSD